jgi:hypothetical protein
MVRVIGRSEAKKRTSRGTKMLEAARKELEAQATKKRAAQACKTPPTKEEPPKAPPPLRRKNPRQCQFV